MITGPSPTVSQRLRALHLTPCSAVCSPPQRRLVLVQEYAARGDLYGIHRAMNRRMTEQQLTELVLVPFVDALSYLHARGICHRGGCGVEGLGQHEYFQGQSISSCLCCAGAASVRKHAARR